MIPFERLRTKSDELNRVQENVERALNPLILAPPNDGILIENVKLVPGKNDVPHRLQRRLRGWYASRLRLATSSWTAVTLTSPWTAAGGGFPTPSWRIADGVTVKFRGLARRTGTFAAGNQLATIPAALNPGRDVIDNAFFNAGGNTQCTLYMPPGGTVLRIDTASAAGVTDVGFDGLSYELATPLASSSLYDLNDSLAATQQANFLRIVSPSAMTVDLWVF